MTGSFPHSALEWRMQNNEPTFSSGTTPTGSMREGMDLEGKTQSEWFLHEFHLPALEKKSTWKKNAEECWSSESSCQVVSGRDVKGLVTGHYQLPQTVTESQWWGWESGIHKLTFNKFTMLREMEIKQNVVVCKSHKPIFYSQQNTKNISNVKSKTC